MAGKRRHEKRPKMKVPPQGLDPFVYLLRRRLADKRNGLTVAGIAQRAKVCRVNLQRIIAGDVNPTLAICRRVGAFAGIRFELVEFDVPPAGGPPRKGYYAERSKAYYEARHGQLAGGANPDPATSGDTNGTKGPKATSAPVGEHSENADDIPPGVLLRPEIVRAGRLEAQRRTRGSKQPPTEPDGAGQGP